MVARLVAWLCVAGLGITFAFVVQWITWPFIALVLGVLWVVALFLAASVEGTPRRK